MAFIEKTFSRANTGQPAIENLRIEVVVPRFSFRIEQDLAQRYVSDYQTFSVAHTPDDESYRVHLPFDRLVGADAADIYGFFRYHFIQVLNPQTDPDDISFPFTVYIKDPQGQEIASETFEGIFYQKRPHASFYDTRHYGQEYADFEQTYGPQGELNVEGLKKLPLMLERQAFIINKKVFELLKYALSRGAGERALSDVFMLEFIQLLTDMSDGHPRLTAFEDVISYTQMAELLRSRELTLSEEIYRFILENFNKLFDFPLVLPEIQTLAVKGELEVISDAELTLADLDFYDLSVEYSQPNSALNILRYDWTASAQEPRGHRIPFAFGEQQPVVANNIQGLLTVRVKGFDGAVLWERHVDPSDEELQHLIIRIHEYPGENAPAGQPGRPPQRIKKLRGKVLQRGNAYQLKGLTIVVQAREAADAPFKIVSATQTDQSGNFSTNYPYGDYVAAQVLVSLMPNSPADLAIHPENTNETIADDFIYLMLTPDDVVEEAAGDPDADKDCDCHKPNKAGRLPDQEDLIASGEYTQDMGGGCMNLSTPNRTLQEYSYNAIVRTSDPDVANYVLQKTTRDGKVHYALAGGNQKLQRGIVDLDNPIRWEDAPDAKENLSLYQAVTVATGHILHFKSVFKADGYSLGDLVYSLPLAPGQKKQIVVLESSHVLSGAESQTLSQDERLSAGLVSDRIITDQLNGGISEDLSGRSKAHTSGMSAGLGVGVSYGGIGGSLGVAGGFSNSNSSASQNSSRNISQFFGEKLRQMLMQNAESYRKLNASVVTTVSQGQSYGVTTEVVANHNHCHSLTMMYFEVLRHYAIFQEVSHVEECVFVPLLLTHFSTENIHKWKDVLAQHLLPIPSDTYLKGIVRLFTGFERQHPLLKAFDANERIKTNYERVDFPPPGAAYADGVIRNIEGEFTLRIQLKRPKSKYDRIKSLPIISQTIYRKEVDPFATAKKGFGDAFLGFITGGLSLAATGAPGTDIQYKTVEEEILVRAQIFDQFMSLDANYQSVPPAQCIRIKTFKPRTINTTFFGYTFSGTYTGEEFFEDGMLDKQQWTTYSRIMGYPDVYSFLEYYFAGRLVAEWDEIFEQDILPQVYTVLVDSIRNDGFGWDLTSMERYTGGHKRMRIRIKGSSTKTRRQLPGDLRITCDDPDVATLRGGNTTLILENIRMNYSTDFYEGKLYHGYSGNGLLDGVDLHIPLTTRDEIKPRTEDRYLVNGLIEHLNSNIEHYNKILWSNLDPDRRYMLLDGFSIQTYTSTGHKSVMRSLASVVKNELIAIAGNSLVFPVADGYKVGRNSILEEAGENVYVEKTLLDYYKPLTPMPPFRVSVPTRGVYMEAIQGSCDACEKVKENSSQDWDKFRTEEPTSITPVVPPTPTVIDYKPEYRDFATPMVNIQNAPDTPAPAAGLAQLSDLLGKAGVFKDITGLAGNQDNVMRTYLSNQENAKAFAEMAKSMATQQHNTQNAQRISESIDRARQEGTITSEDAQSLTRQHLQQQIDGGENARETAQFEREQRRPSLSEVAADAANRGQTVQAQRTDADGTHEAIEIAGQTASEVAIHYDVPLVPQPNKTSCWAAAMAMLVSYQRSIQTASSMALSAAELAAEVGFTLEQSYGWDRLTAVKDHFGFEEIPLQGSQYPSPAQWQSWLETYGPLYITVVGTPSHAIIVKGISGDLTDTGTLLSILNPWNTGETFDDDPVEFNPPNEGLSTQLSVQELNRRMNGGDLSSLAIYEEWRVLYLPGLGTPSSSTPPSGGAGARNTLAVRLRNLHIPNTSSSLGNAGEARIEIKSVDLGDADAPNIVQQAGANGRARIDISGLPAGDYFLNVVPVHTFAYSIARIRAHVTDGIDRIYEGIHNRIRLHVAVDDASGARTFAFDESTLQERARVDQDTYRNIVQESRGEAIIRLQPLWMRSPNLGTAAYGRSRSIGSVVVHHTGNSAANPSINTFIDGDRVSIHYLMDINGRLIKMVNEDQIAKHAGNSYWNGTFRLNDSSIGIEICNGNGENYAPEQIDALVLLLRSMVDDGTISAEHVRNIVGHSDIATTDFNNPVEPSGDGGSIRIDAGRRIQDPGPLFDWNRLTRENLTFTPHRDAAGSDHYLAVFSQIPDLVLRLRDNDRDSKYGGTERTLAAGTANTVIQAIQNDLRAIGYLVNTDGNFTSKTENAIKVFRVRAFSNTDAERLPGNINPQSGSVSGRIDFDTAKKIRDYSPLANPI